MDDLSGRQLGPYQIVAPLGEGGMAAVYKAFQPSVNRYVALKVLPQYFARDPQFAARFEREAQLLAQLQHPNILPVFDYGRAAAEDMPGGAFTYIAMPLILGGSLEGLMRSRRLDQAAIRKVISQVGDALDYAHSRNLIHRDIKPANVLLDERGNCLLTDFGLARLVEGSARLTTSGAIMGTPAYMSPEQGRGLPLDRRTDVYSLGVILYELAVGRPPFEADTPMVVVVKHINDPLPLPSAIVPKFPAALERVIVTALTKDPAQRYQSAGALVEALNAALDEIEGPRRSALPAAPSVPAASPRVATTLPAPPPAGQARPSTLIQHAWWAAPLAGLALLLGAAGLAGAGFLIYNLAAGRGPTPTTPAAATPAPLSTATARPFQQAFAGGPLLDEDFEDGQAQDWTAVAGGAQVVTLPDGNHALQLSQGEFGGGYMVYDPSFDWTQQDYTLEADVMAADVRPNSTSVRMTVRLPAPAVGQVCLGYSATLGAGWAALAKVEAANNDCNNSTWQETDLGVWAGGDLKPDVWQHLRVEVQGQDLQYYVDDRLIVSGTDFEASWRTGGLGLAVFQTDRAYFDNVRVQARDGSPLPGAEENNWVISFTRAYPPDTWPAGDHGYSLNLHCPDGAAADNTVAYDFRTEAGLPRPPEGGTLFLTDAGPRDEFIGGAAIDSFNPAYNVLAVYNLGPLTRAEAERALTGCQVNLDWAASSADPLAPLMMFQH